MVFTSAEDLQKAKEMLVGSDKENESQSEEPHSE